MRRWAKRTLVLATAIVVGIVLIAGCEEEQELPDAKRARLIAVENAQLKSEIEKQKRNCERKIASQKEQLDKCLQTNKALQEASKENIEKLMDTALMMAVEENTKLLEENQSLKAQMEQLQMDKEILKKELEEVKKQAGS